MTTTGQAGRQVEEFFKRFGSGVNFLMLLAAFVGGSMVLGSWRTTQETNDAKTVEWQNNHEAYHRDALADRKEAQGRTDVLISKINEATLLSDRKIDSLEQRVATVEKAVNTVEQNAALTNRTLNEINGNLQVMKEILSRVEKKQGG